MTKRIVITGLGTVNCLGENAEQTWDNVKHGRSGISCIDRVDVSDMGVKVGFSNSSLGDVRQYRHTGQHI
jgi:3-oxoacyl-[acyl-carrier-protein] synthase II